MEDNSGVVLVLNVAFQTTSSLPNIDLGTTSSNAIIVTVNIVN
jgi:hypothetical protein